MNIFFWRKPPVALTPPIRGVNLGGWLVLEKWMTPSLFEGMDASDEYGYCTRASKAAMEKLESHRRTFITKNDFVWLKQQGIDAVRLPVGYWVFGDEQPYAGTIDYVDQTFAWAEQTGIKVLLDLHGAPGSQNGKDHSGRIGKKAWHTSEQNIAKTLDVLGRLADRYKDSTSLLGVELLNEPGWMLPRGRLRRYYQASYALIRKICGDAVWVVYSDFFPPFFWKTSIRRHKYTNMYVDTHHYQAFSRQDRRSDLARHMQKILRKTPRRLARMQRTNPVIVGEWSLALDPQSLRGLNAAQIEAAYRAYAGAQLVAYEHAAAWFYWSYKTEEGGVWSFRDCVEKGLLPSYGDAQ